MNIKAITIKYRPGFCLLCNEPIQKIGILWCTLGHRKKHDKRLKTNPVQYGNVICRTADELEYRITSGLPLRLVAQQMYEEESQKPANEQDKAEIERLKTRLESLEKEIGTSNGALPAATKKP